jgi:hypothetical protein
MRRTMTIAAACVVVGLTSSSAVAANCGQSDVARARRATAAFHSVARAEAAGYASTLDSLGCFENPGVGGMGLHYLRADLLDDEVDVAAPEALVYEMRANGKRKLVGLEYIVPIDAWTEAGPPMLFDQHFHQHPVLPLYVLHAWVWRPNPDGMFADWNPRVRDCPAGVPIFGA